VRPPERIELGDLLLRPYTLADAPALTRAINENLEHLRPWMPWATAERTPDDERPFLEHALEGWKKETEFVYGIWLGDPEELIGGCGLHARRGPGVLEIGYWIAKRHEGKGYVRRTAQALTETALALPGIERVEIRCDEANVRSAAIPRSLGYRLDRVEEDGVNAPGESGRGMVWVFERPAPPAPGGSGTAARR
jgi:RimJ/RimL family protein N-acetyltransferase